MKAYPQADYPVSIRRAAGDEVPAVAHLYDGIYTMTLNDSVDIQFVPDVSAIAPPWEDHLLPEDMDEITTSDQARMASALLSFTVVTPNPARVGDVERFDLLGGFDRPGFVRYVDPVEFSDFSHELEQLRSVLNDRHSDRTVSGLRQYGVIRFVESEIVAAPWLDPSDQYWLRDEGATSAGGQS